MTVLLLLCRVVLAAVFLVSAVAKLRDGAGSRKAVEEFGVPAGLVPVVALGLPYAELGCAVLLMTADPGATAGSIASALLLSAFTLAIAANLLRGRTPDCHCFGQLDSGATSWRSVGRNGLLIALALLPLLDAGSLAFPGSTLASYSSEQLAVGFSLAALTLTVGALGMFCRTLLRQYGTVLLRLEAIEAGSPSAPARPAPAFELPDLDGDLVSLDDVLAEGQPVLVAFISPTCVMCSDLVPHLAQWQSTDEPLALLVLSTGSVSDNRDKLGENSLRVLLQDNWEVAEAYASQGTPCAFLVGVDGLIAGAAAYGVDGVRELHDSTVSLMRGEPVALHQIVPRPVGVGDELPELELETEAGEPSSLQALAPVETVLLFWRTTCGFCAAITDDVAAFESSATVLLVTGSELAEVRGSGLPYPIVRDPQNRLNAALQIPGTPAAVRVVGSTLVSEVAVGGPEVLALLSSHPSG